MRGKLVRHNAAESKSVKPCCESRGDLKVMHGMHKNMEYLHLMVTVLKINMKK